MPVCPWNTHANTHGVKKLRGKSSSKEASLHCEAGRYKKNHINAVRGEKQRGRNVSVNAIWRELIFATGQTRPQGASLDRCKIFKHA